MACLRLGSTGVDGLVKSELLGGRRRRSPGAQGRRARQIQDASSLTVTRRARTAVEVEGRAAVRSWWEEGRGWEGFFFVRVCVWGRMWCGDGKLRTERGAVLNRERPWPQTTRVCQQSQSIRSILIMVLNIDENKNCLYNLPVIYKMNL